MSVKSHLYWVELITPSHEEIWEGRTHKTHTCKPNYAQNVPSLKNPHGIKCPSHVGCAQRTSGRRWTTDQQLRQMWEVSAVIHIHSSSAWTPAGVLCPRSANSQDSDDKGGLPYMSQVSAGTHTHTHACTHAHTHAHSCHQFAWFTIITITHHLRNNIDVQHWHKKKIQYVLLFLSL